MILADEPCALKAPWIDQRLFVRGVHDLKAVLLGHSSEEPADLLLSRVVHGRGGAVKQQYVGSTRRGQRAYLEEQRQDPL